MKHFTLPKDGGLMEADLPQGILHSYEKIVTDIYDDAASASADIAREITEAIRSHKGPGRFKLGLTTGVTPAALYKELARTTTGSHVNIYNNAQYGSVYTETMQDYFPK